MRLLLVEDDRLFGDAFMRSLVREGHAVDWIERARDFDATIASNLYQCLLLDLALPDGDGEELLRTARTRLPGLACVVITGRVVASKRVELLDRGADDFLVKPIDLDEAAARIRSVTRRAGAARSLDPEIQHGPLKVQASRRRVTWHDKPVSLTNKEYWLLETLLRGQGRILSRARLEEALYGWATEITSNAVEVHIHHLRRKLAPDLIVSVRNVGYHLAPIAPNG